MSDWLVRAATIQNPAWAKLFLVGMSLWFYGYYNPWYLLILVGSLLVNQGISAAMEHGRSRKLLLTLGLIANIGLLFYFKYFNFSWTTAISSSIQTGR